VAGGIPPMTRSPCSLVGTVLTLPREEYAAAIESVVSEGVKLLSGLPRILSQPRVPRRAGPTDGMSPAHSERRLSER